MGKSESKSRDAKPAKSKGGPIRDKGGSRSVGAKSKGGPINDKGGSGA